MTAIAGLVHEGKVYIGGDSAGTDRSFGQTNRGPKVFISGDMIFGTTGSVRMSQLLQYEFSPPRAYEGEDGMAYMVKRFIPSLRSLYRDGGCLEIDSCVEKGGFFLCGRMGSLYAIESDFQVGCSGLSYYAEGCGQDLVLGSLHTTEGMAFSPEERITKALKAAEEFSAGVRGPFTILSV